MKRAVAGIIVLICFSGCMTAHYTGDGHQAPISPPASFLTGTIPGLNQFLLGERIEGIAYLAATVLAGGLAYFAYGIENTTEQPQYPIPFYISAAATAAVVYWQYADGVYGSYKQRAEYNEVRPRFVPAQIYIGMTEHDFLLARGFRPAEINESTGSWGVHQQWVYSLGEIYYFENGKLASWQLTK